MLLSTVTYISVTLDGVLDWILDLLATLTQQVIIITLNYGAIANLHTLQFTTTHAKSLPACSVFTRCFLVTAYNNCYSSVSVLQFSLNGGSLPIVNSYSSCPPYNPSTQTTVQNPVSNSTSIATRGNLFVCDRCLETALHVTGLLLLLLLLYILSGEMLKEKITTSQNASIAGLWVVFHVLRGWR
jgi:hypothetical protein